MICFGALSKLVCPVGYFGVAPWGYALGVPFGIGVSIFCAAGTSRGSSKTCTRRQAHFSHMSFSHFPVCGRGCRPVPLRPRSWCCMGVSKLPTSMPSRRLGVSHSVRDGSRIALRENPMPPWIARPGTSGKARIRKFRCTSCGSPHRPWSFVLLQGEHLVEAWRRLPLLCKFAFPHDFAERIYIT